MGQAVGVFICFSYWQQPSPRCLPSWHQIAQATQLRSVRVGGRFLRRKVTLRVTRFSPSPQAVAAADLAIPLYRPVEPVVAGSSPVRLVENALGNTSGAFRVALGCMHLQRFAHRNVPLHMT